MSAVRVPPEGSVLNRLFGRCESETWCSFPALFLFDIVQCERQQQLLVQHGQILKTCTLESGGKDG